MSLLFDHLELIPNHLMKYYSPSYFRLKFTLTILVIDHNVLEP